jgi:transposase
MDGQECPGCRRLEEEVRQLREELRQLKAGLGKNASNSSLPPSANPPQAPAPVTKEKTGRKRGGQPGHPPHLKQLLPPERLSATHAFVPAECAHCQTALPPESSPADPEPRRHQVADLPPVRAEVIEYQGHGRTCAKCGQVTWASIPAGVRQHSIGPNLAAAMSYLSGCHQVSKRGVEEIVETLFEVPVSLGTVSNLEQEMSAALAPAHQEAMEAVRQADVKYVDETGWKLQGRKHWVWVAATLQATVFIVHASRGLTALQKLLGEDVEGTVVSDRWSAYGRLKLYQRQLCWAHLQRDFQALVDWGGEAKPYGEELLGLAEDTFHWWKRVRDGTLTRSTLRTYIDECRPWLRDLLERGSVCGCAKTAALCGNLLALEPALWTFARRLGVEPTNNHAERAVRKAVLWRKKSFGSVSAGGCRFAERILTVVQTLRSQGRQVWRYLSAALHALRNQTQAPRLACG